MNRNILFLILLLNTAVGSVALASTSLKNPSCQNIYQSIYQIKKPSLFEFAEIAQKKYPAFHRKNLDYKQYIKSGLDTGKMLLFYTANLNPKSSKAILINKIFAQAEVTIEAQWAYTDILRYYQGQVRDHAMTQEEASQSTQRAQDFFKEKFRRPLAYLAKQLLIQCDPANSADVGMFQTVLLSLEEYSEQDSYRLGVGLSLPKINHSSR